jgi:hypothetical protein
MGTSRKVEEPLLWIFGEESKMKKKKMCQI